MMDNQYYIYKTTNLINQKQYIGKHFGRIDDSYLGSGILLKKAIEKYGKENFKKEILYISQSEEENCEKEKYYIELYNAIESDNFYNIAEGGQGGFVTRGYTEEQRQQVNKKISQQLKKNHPMKGKHHTEQTKEKIKEKLKEYWTEERRMEQSKRYMGENNPMYGKKHTEESIQKMVANRNLDFMKTPQYRQKMSKATSGQKNGNYGNKDEKAKNGKHILMYDQQHNLIRTFNTKTMALKFLQIKGHTQLDNAIKKKSLYRGYYWEQTN